MSARVKDPCQNCGALLYYVGDDRGDDVLHCHHCGTLVTVFNPPEQEVVVPEVWKFVNKPGDQS